VWIGKWEIRKDLKKWIESLAGASAERKAEISDIKNEIYTMRLSIEAMHKKLEKIEQILDKVSE
jgi:hypothetical protein